MTQPWPPLPLFDLFLALQPPLHLVAEDYGLLLRALEQGFGCADLDDLQATCRQLWLRGTDPRSHEQFETAFAAYRQRIARQAEAFAAAAATTEPADAAPEIAEAPTDAIVPPAPVSTLPPATAPTSTPAPEPQRRETLGAIRGAIAASITPSAGGYTLVPTEFPFEPRPTQQAWRRLRQPARRGTTGQVDIQAAIAAIARDGACAEIPLQPKRVNLLQLVLFVDRDGSMVPFHLPCDRWLATIDPQHFARVDCYYFRNCPRDSVYRQAKGAGTVPLEEVLRLLSPSRTIAIILSDAGAARGGYNPARVDLTREFLQTLQPYARSLVWLNPVPADRWRETETTAGEIAQLVADLGGFAGELNQVGLKQWRY